ncbi:DUF2871 domain-containing protein [Acholeplasma hippikon]|uniref:Protein of uncharacterized function (DUF2871) n=1 Tax=Acholeplasma hippikon TaxID=264636 RepID=A0A449BJS6_9MOLU|nr:DUF2871 domain-containing protein [Acholeplasma hippikon]VEU82688.1 Protein of uncharacterised function (DUF2871) [Acholeplasma hippikon]
MKKLAKISFYYSILGLVLGIFYREFTKINDFTGETVLGGLHTHALALGTLFFLIVLIVEKQFKLTESKKFKPFFIVYNSGLIGLLVMMMIRGILEVLGTNVTTGWDLTISWLAGFAHMAMAAGFVRFFLMLFKQIDLIEKQSE